MSGPVPRDVYYSEEHHNFYDARTRIGMGWGFYNAWRALRKDFPKTAEATAHGQREQNVSGGGK